MKVLVIASLADSLLNFREHLLLAMVNRGFEVHVAAPSIGVDTAIRRDLEHRGLIAHDINMNRTGINLIADFHTLYLLTVLMRRNEFDMVLGYTVKPVVYGTLAAWLTGVRHRFALITGLGYAFTGQAKGRRKVVQNVVQWLYRLALRRAHLVFFQNPDDQMFFMEKGILSAESKSVVINGSGIDLTRFPVTPIPTEAPHFLLIARLLGDKGVREYFHAAQLIKNKYPRVQFSLVGWLDENPDAITQAELDTWLETGVLNYLGQLKDVRPAIAQCSCYVLPSYREGTPRTVLEAMAMGRPIITTDAPGCRETVVDGENGFLVPVKLVGELTAAMKKFIDQPDLIGQMGKRSRQLAEEKYDVNKVNEQMLNEMGIK